MMENCGDVIGKYVRVFNKQRSYEDVKCPFCDGKKVIEKYGWKWGCNSCDEDGLVPLLVGEETILNETVYRVEARIKTLEDEEEGWIETWRVKSYGWFGSGPAQKNEEQIVKPEECVFCTMDGVTNEG